MTRHAPLVVFCFPYREVGGVSSQFLRLAQHLTSEGIDSALIDYADGAMATQNRAEGSRVALFEFVDGIPMQLPAGAIVIMQAMTPWTVWRELHGGDDVRVLLWLCHPFNLIPTIPVWNRFIRSRNIGPLVLRFFFRNIYARSLLFFHAALASRGVISIDAPCLEQAMLYFGGASGDVSLVPVPCPTKSHCRPGIRDIAEGPGEAMFPESDFRRPAEVIESFIWVGRLADFKIPILKFTIARLDSIYNELDKEVTIHIIGDGPMAQNLQAFCAVLKTLRVRFYGHVSQKSIKKTVNLSRCVALAMGTSALELGSLGLPTILLNFTYDRTVRHHDFVWLFEQEGYSVGRQICNKRCVHSDGMEALLVEASENYVELGRKTAEYVAFHHDLERVAEKLLVSIEKCEYRWHQFRVSLGDSLPWQYALREKVRALTTRIKTREVGR